VSGLSLESVGEFVGRIGIRMLALVSSEPGLDEFLRFQGWNVRARDIPVARVAMAAQSLKDRIESLVGGRVTPATVALVLRDARTLGDALVDFATLPPPAGAPAGFTEALVQDLLTHVMSGALGDVAPTIRSVLAAAGIVRRRLVPSSPIRGQYLRLEIAPAAIGRLVADPGGAMADAFGWRTAGFQPLDVLEPILDVGARAGLRTYAGDLDPEYVRLFLPGLEPAASGPRQIVVPLVAYDGGAARTRLGLIVAGLPSVGSELPGIGAAVYAEGTADLSLLASEQFTIGVRGEFAAGRSFGIVVRPSGLSIAGSSVGSPSASVSISVLFGSPTGSPRILVGTPDGSRIEFARLRGSVGLSAQVGRQPDAALEFGVVGARVVLRAGERDGFLRAILPAEGFAARFDASIRVAVSGRVCFAGSGALELNLPTTIPLGPLLIDGVSLVVRPDDAGIRASAGANAIVTLGPLRVAVNGVGLAAGVMFPSSMGGNAGLVHAEFAAAPPTGATVQVSAGPVSGGGTLRFDNAAGRYSGALALRIGPVALNALGLIETRSPNVQGGFSMLVLLSAEFPRVPLGFGFTLDGVGGLGGVHRSVNTEALQAGVRAGNLGHILFPSDPVANIGRLLGELERVFPAAQDRYVFGPVAKFGWGTPKVISAEIGLMIELPEPIRIVLLGQIEAFFPTRQAAVVELHVDVLGILDFGRKELSIDARIHDSRLAVFSLEGDIAFRVNWGDEPYFMVSIGGFNPHFQAPTNFPTLRRLRLALGVGNNPRLRLEAYFALTSNTLQFGASAELHVDILIVTIDGSLSFDALITFSPFAFRVDFEAFVSVKVFGLTLLAIRVRGLLEGPRPWHIAGEAHLTVLFFEVSASFDIRFGEIGGDEEHRAEVDIGAQVAAALGEAGAWSAELEPGRAPAVTRRTLVGEEADLVLVDPDGFAVARQKVAPLHQPLTRFGNERLAVAQEIGVESVHVGEDGATPDAVRDFFAAGQFVDLTDAERLSRPSFEKMQAGVRVAGTGPRYGVAVYARIGYETIVLRNQDRVSRHVDYVAPALLGVVLSGIASEEHRTAGNDVSRFSPAPGSVPRVGLADEAFAVADATTLRATESVRSDGTMGSAAGALSTYDASHPDERGARVVVPTFLLRSAA